MTGEQGTHFFTGALLVCAYFLFGGLLLLVLWRSWKSISASRESVEIAEKLVQPLGGFYLPSVSFLSRFYGPHLGILRRIQGSLILECTKRGIFECDPVSVVRIIRWIPNVHGLLLPLTLMFDRQRAKFLDLLCVPSGELMTVATNFSVSDATGRYNSPAYIFLTPRNSWPRFLFARDLEWGTPSKRLYFIDKVNCRIETSQPAETEKFLSQRGLLEAMEGISAVESDGRTLFFFGKKLESGDSGPSRAERIQKLKLITTSVTRTVPGTPVKLQEIKTSSGLLKNLFRCGLFLLIPTLIFLAMVDNVKESVQLTEQAYYTGWAIVIGLIMYRETRARWITSI